MSDSYEIEWKRDPDAPRPEDMYSGTREVAVEKFLEEADVDLDSVSINVPRSRRLSKSYGFYTVCEFVVENPAEAYFIYTLAKDQVNEMGFGKEGVERLKEDLDDRWDEDDFNHEE